jgi:hypothetical protein
VAIGNPLEIGVSIEKSPMVYFPLPCLITGGCGFGGTMGYPIICKLADKLILGGAVPVRSGLQFTIVIGAPYPS